MLLDSSHKKWLIGTGLAAALSLGVYAWLDRLTPDGVIGRSSAGLWYGILGSALMIFAGLLSALRKVPSWWWIGSRKLWLKGHIWLGLLSVVLILCHSGFSWGGPLELALWVVLILVIFTGIVGLVLQQVLPRLMTTRVQSEAPYEQIPHLCELMRRRADRLVESIWAIDLQVSQADMNKSQVGQGAKVQLQEFYERHVRSYLTDGSRRSPVLASPLKAEGTFAYFRELPGLKDVQSQISDLEGLCNERRQMAEQQRLHVWLHAWLMVHIPLSVLLLVLGVAHVVAVLYY